MIFGFQIYVKNAMVWRGFWAKTRELIKQSNKHIIILYSPKRSKNNDKQSKSIVYELSLKPNEVKLTN